MKIYDFDEILAERGDVVSAAVDNRYLELLASLPLSALRTECGLSQKAIATELKVSQAAVSKMETRSDLLLSTVFRYVEALGGGIHLGISIKDRDYILEPTNDRRTAFVLKKEKRVSPAVLFGAHHSGAKFQSIAPGPHIESWRSGRVRSAPVANDGKYAGNNECVELLAA